MVLEAWGLASGWWPGLSGLASVAWGPGVHIRLFIGLLYPYDMSTYWTSSASIFFSFLKKSIQYIYLHYLECYQIIKGLNQQKQVCGYSFVGVQHGIWHHSMSWWVHNSGGGSFQYLRVVGIFPGIDPLFDIFISHWVPFYAQLDLIGPLFYKKKIWFVSITFSSRDNLTYILSIVSAKSVIWPFSSILYQYFPWFSILLTPFFYCS